VMAANPCPCGMSGGKGLECICSPVQRRRYLGRLSRPLVDRIDLQLTMHRISLADIAAGEAAESSSRIAGRVHDARAAQRERLSRWGLDVNAEAGAALLKKELRPPRQATADLDRAMDLQVLTGRGYSRVLRVAWTVADLRGLGSPDRDCVGTALAFRQQVNAA
jgi:magnesium chelatase family protein